MIYIDRFEADYAVCYSENKKIDIHLSKIKGAPKEGDILKKENDFYIIDLDETKARRKTINNLQNSLWE